MNKNLQYLYILFGWIILIILFDQYYPMQKTGKINSYLKWLNEYKSDYNKNMKEEITISIHNDNKEFVLSSKNIKEHDYILRILDLIANSSFLKFNKSTDKSTYTLKINQNEKYQTYIVDKNNLSTITDKNLMKLFQIYSD